MSDLTIKRERFAQRYVEHGNASEAYRQSYDCAESAPQTIANEGYKLTQDPDVAKRITELQELRLRRHKVTADRVIAEMAKLAFGDIRKAYDENGNLKPITSLDDDTAAMIAGIEVEELFEGFGRDREQIGHTRKLKLADKKAALDSLFKHLGLFTDKLELTGKDGNPIEISDAKSALLRGVVSDPPSGGADQAD